MTTAKSGVAPAKAKSKKLTKKIASSAPVDQPNDPVLKKRVPMHAQIEQALPKEARDTNFSYRWCADYGKGKMQRYVAAGWEHVKDAHGKQITKPSGETLYLMKLPKEYRQEDNLAKRKKIIDTSKKFEESHGANANPDDSSQRADDNDNVPEYLAKGQNASSS